MFRTLSKFSVDKCWRHKQIFSIRNVGHTLNYQCIFPSILRKRLIQAWRPAFASPINLPLQHTIPDNASYYGKLFRQLGIDFECNPSFLIPTLNELNKYVDKLNVRANNRPKKLKLAFTTVGKIRKFIGDCQRVYFKTHGILSNKCGKRQDPCGAKQKKKSSTCKESKEKIDADGAKKKRKNPKKELSGPCPYIKEECLKRGKGKQGICKKVSAGSCNTDKGKKDRCRKAIPCKKKGSSSTCAAKAGSKKSSKQTSCASKAAEKKKDPCSSKKSTCSTKDAKAGKTKNVCKEKKKDVCSSKKSTSASKDDVCGKKKDSGKKSTCPSKDDGCKKKSDPCGTKAAVCGQKGKSSGEKPTCPSKEDKCKTDDPCASKSKGSGDSKAKCGQDPCEKPCENPCGDPCDKPPDPCKVCENLPPKEKKKCERERKRWMQKKAAWEKKWLKKNSK